MYFESSSSRERKIKSGGYCEERSSARRAKLQTRLLGEGKTHGLLVQGLFIGRVAGTEQRLRSCSLRFKALTVSHSERVEDAHTMCACPGPNPGDSHTLSFHSARSARGMVRL